tara:strand:+ start:123 stop:749 length:627 start_codon:yes stop_codon:yes gene_type:complete
MALKKENVIKYWEERSAKQKRNTVGFSGNINNQMFEYDEKYKFVKNNLLKYTDIHIPTVDYGAGVGRWSSVFPKYLGVEMTADLIAYARKDFPHKVFLKIDHPFEMPEKLMRMDNLRLFTSTVLQHNSEQDILEFFESIRKFKFSEFVFYENNFADAPHCKGRSPSKYRKILDMFYDIYEFDSDEHIVHGENHGILVVKVKYNQSTVV